MGFGAKAGLFPLHAWLPAAHPVAPSPASAVLSGVITKAGVFCIIRVIYFQFGADFLRDTWVQRSWIAVALLTILMGSLMAFREKQLKTRLAYSTVSQVSYVLLGLFFLNEAAFAGALLHVLYHSVLKDGLFLSAGNILYQTHLEYVGDLKGLGRQMPLTLSCFAIFSLGLTGIPPFAGFLSKWELATGALSSGLLPYAWLAPAVLLISAMLTAGYLFPIVIHGFFPGRAYRSEGPDTGEAPVAMVGVVGALAAATVVLGLFGGPILKFFLDLAGTVLL
jgi:multicomponent Na+:H+ antiporter subunit D